MRTRGSLRVESSSVPPGRVPVVSVPKFQHMALAVWLKSSYLDPVVPDNWHWGLAPQ